MATSRVKTWVKELLTFADLNAEFDNQLLGPYDCNGTQLTFDADADTYLQTSTDDRLAWFFKGTDLMHFDATVSSPVNGFDIADSAAGTSPSLTMRGADSNIGFNVVGLGTGKLESDGDVVIGLHGHEMYVGRP